MGVRSQCLGFLRALLVRCLELIDLDGVIWQCLTKCTHLGMFIIVDVFLNLKKSFLCVAIS